MDSEVWQLCLKLKQMVGLPKLFIMRLATSSFYHKNVYVRRTVFPAESLKAKCCTMQTLYYGLDLWFACGPSGLKVNIHIL